MALYASQATSARFQGHEIGSRKCGGTDTQRGGGRARAGSCEGGGILNGKEIGGEKKHLCKF